MGDVDLAPVFRAVVTKDVAAHAAVMSATKQHKLAAAVEALRHRGIGTPDAVVPDAIATHMNWFNRAQSCDDSHLKLVLAAHALMANEALPCRFRRVAAGHGASAGVVRVDVCSATFG